MIVRLFCLFSVLTVMHARAEFDKDDRPLQKAVSPQVQRSLKGLANDANPCLKAAADAAIAAARHTPNWWLAYSDSDLPIVHALHVQRVRSGKISSAAPGTYRVEIDFGLATENESEWGGSLDYLVSVKQGKRSCDVNSVQLQ
jgi:hypothetical protein